MKFEEEKIDKLSCYFLSKICC